jgi:thiamine-phosphate pyrophosphorylase
MAGRCLFYYITDRSQFSGSESNRRRELLVKVGEAARAGVDYIQLREKDLSTRELEVFAREAVAAIREKSRTTNHALPTTRLLINSRTDVALAVDADGIHLRGEDVSSGDVRRIVGTVAARTVESQGLKPPVTRRFIVAVSCHSAKDVLRAQAEGADFAVFAPVFEKKDDPTAQPRGVDTLRQACRTDIPVLALGGVTLENAALCLEAGAAGIAGIRLFQENDISAVISVVRELTGS